VHTNAAILRAQYTLEVKCATFIFYNFANSRDIFSPFYQFIQRKWCYVFATCS